MRNNIVFFYRRTLRTIVLCCGFPRAAAFAFLQKVLRGRLLSVRVKNSGDRNLLKAQMKKSALPTGWASTGRVAEISFAGRKLCSIKLAEGAEANAQQFYFSRSLKDLKASLNIFAKNGMTLPLHATAMVFEPGCNAGKNLFYFSDRYGCQVFGADVYAPAIEVAERAAIFAGEKINVADLISGKMLEAFADRHFDLIFLSSHLAHVAHLPGGIKAYLARLMRITKTAVFIEKHEKETAMAAKHLGFWTIVWKKSLLGYFTHGDSVQEPP